MAELVNLAILVVLTFIMLLLFLILRKMSQKVELPQPEPQVFETKGPEPEKPTINVLIVSPDSVE